VEYKWGDVDGLRFRFVRRNSSSVPRSMHYCTRGVFTDDECKPFCRDCGSPCIELCPNPNCRARILDVLLEADLQSCPRCREKWMYDPDRPDADQKCCE
jgi:hypothetical protein